MCAGAVWCVFRCNECECIGVVWWDECIGVVHGNGTWVGLW